MLFIADEVMTGWGRTGTLFACEQAGISPDILCFAKGMTGGSLPLAVTLCSAPIFDAHLSTDRRGRSFIRALTPPIRSPARPRLPISRSGGREPVIERILSLTANQALCLKDLEADPRFSNLRQLGTITAFELANAQQGYLADIALAMRARLLERGVLLRPLGSTVYVMPPYCTTKDELKFVYRSLVDIVDEVLA